MSRADRRKPLKAAWDARRNTMPTKRDRRNLGGRAILQLNRATHGRYFNKSGVPIGLGTYAYLAGQGEYRCVARTEIGDIVVSTAWLGVDYGYAFGRGLIFETIIFGGERDGEAYRYSTLSEARVGHNVLVRSLPDGDAW